MAETDQLIGEIEGAKVDAQFLEIQVQRLAETVEALNYKKDQLIDEKKASEQRLEELTVQWKSQEEIAHKRLQAKLKRDMSVEVRELIANLELIQENNKEIDGKLRSEKENYDKLLSEKSHAEEELALREKELE